jgi:Type IV leader peptidase family.
MTELPDLLQIAAAILTLIAALTDLRSRQIPNWLVVAGLLAGFILNAYLQGWPGLLQAARGFGLALLIYCPCTCSAPWAAATSS